MSFGKLGKKIGQLTQWTTEKLGSKSKTETSEEFRRLQEETKVRRDCLRAIQEPLEMYYKQLAKEKGSKLLLEALANGFETYGSILPEGSSYGASLQAAANVHAKIAQEQSNLVNIS
jgi:hypothetical protein